MQTPPTPEASVFPNTKLRVRYIGYLLLACSAALFGLIEWFDFWSGGEDVTLFVVHYALAWIFIIALIHERAYGIVRSWRPENLGLTIILLNLFLISAYALNRSLPVFQDSSQRFSIYLIITSVNLMSFEFQHGLPRWLNYLQYIILGSTIVLYLYMSLFVADVYLVGGIGIIVLGIGAHIFVPLTLLIASILLAIRQTDSRNVTTSWIVAGVVATLTIIGVYTAIWSNRVETINRVVNQAVLHHSPLPLWIDVSENVPVDPISDQILKSEIVYTIRSNKFGDWLFMPNTFSWEEARRHDPLVFIASWFQECTLSADDKIKILQTRADRHHAEERLWSGDNLVTSYVVSDIDLFPEFRLAYTEKYLTIKNQGSGRGRWLNSQEAIYTFQLPEGSVVTSLSLWIDGKEQKGVLTSKQKAKTAYNTVVGVEARDPSIVQWQEGNTVSVKVFPCNVNEDRKFKIGITSLLTEEHGKLVYKSPDFVGPDAGNAQETIRVNLVGASANLELPSEFSRDKRGNYLVEKEYDPDFELLLPVVPMKKSEFIFDRFAYSIDSYQPELGSLTAREVYLDINTTWTDEELDELRSLMADKDVFVYTAEDEFVLLTDENWDALTASLQQRSFSLFPFHLLKDARQSLVVTKGQPLSIQLSDFRDSEFANALSAFFSAGNKPYVYNLGTDVSTYIASMRELRGFQFAQGDVDTLLDWLKNQKYPKNSESDESIILYDANLRITREKLDARSVYREKAPDHLARLFAYNNIMRKVGQTYFENDVTNEALVNEAARAYVVSPVSSLIVLESQRDYDRFNIQDTENSLGNAAKASSGAVPEPHEWALIILFMAFIAFVRYRTSKLKTV